MARASFGCAVFGWRIAPEVRCRCAVAKATVGKRRWHGGVFSAGWCVAMWHPKVGLRPRCRGLRAPGPPRDIWDKRNNGGDLS